MLAEVFRERPARRLPPPAASDDVVIAGFPDARLTATQAHDALGAVIAGLRAPDGELDILALSGGAAGGAFGAGVLVGLARAGRRPTFSIVTGVSTGALIAPFAFLGEAWDERLIDAYTGGHVADMLRIGSLGLPFGPGLLDTQSLEKLVAPFVDQALLEAVAREHACGRRLLISTTNLDSQKACVWDMGAIASRGGPAALRLFSEVLVASASLPGLFPPRLFTVEAGGERFQEMHVDGGVAAPLFILPDAPLRRLQGSGRGPRGRVHVIVNTALEQGVRETQPSLVPVLMQSFDTMLRFSYRQALNVAAAFCELNGLELKVAVMPAAATSARFLQFETEAMSLTFQAAVARAQGEALWQAPHCDRSPVPRRRRMPGQTTSTTTGAKPSRVKR